MGRPVPSSAAMAGLLALMLASPALAAPRQASLAESARRQSERLALENKPGEALEVLRSARVHAAPGDMRYWQFYGDQAWDRGQKPEALQAYGTAWAAGPVHARAMERLIQHFNESGEPLQAIAIGQQGYQRLGEARWLLLAMDAASQASLWDELRALSLKAKADEAKFKRSEMYWLLLAHVANHDADKPRARAAYDQALALNPTLVATRAQVLWFEIDEGDPQRLASHLAKWQDDAQTQPAYWAAYAVALLQLGRVDESLAWFDKQVAEKPDDYLWQLSYVSLLSRARPEQQALVRRDLLGRLKGRLAVSDALPKTEAKALLLAHAGLVRDFEGLAAGDQALREILDRGFNDSDVYESLVASSLAQKQAHAARHWLLRAEADRQKLPAYQLLAVALAENDTPAIERVLAEREQELSAADRVTGLRQIGRNQLALSLTEQSLLQAQDDSTELLRQHRDQLRRQLARWVEAGHESRNLSDLKIRRSEVAASFGHDQGRTTLRIAHNALRADSPNLQLSGLQSENDLSLLAEVSIRNEPMRFTLGTNQRADKSLTYGRFEWTHALSGRLSTRLEVLLNGLTEETSALRAIGSKDKVSVSLGGSLTDQTYGRLELAAQHFNTRQGDSLGRGHRLEGEVGTAVSSSRWPGWQTRISGSTEKNQIADSLPAYLLGPVLPAAQTVEGVLSPRFSTLGIGTTLRFGSSEGSERRTHGLIDGWVGKQWPANERAYSLRAALSLPVASAGQVRAEAFYTNVQGGVSSQANRGMAVWYRHEF